METLDYRNGKYQGPVNSQRRRHGLGIFIDDDLTFYASNWKQNKLHGQTLLYISHGKYIYGEWKDNVLSGLAVFRCGDTVLVGQFANNYPIGRCMLIFQRFNFVCLLEQMQAEWSIIESGTITNHKMLLKYIEKLGMVVPDHYFSLTKFVCNFTLNNNYLKTFPCYVGCCYFGFVNGLAMVFNCNNGLVAIGKHTNEEVTQFGGKFQNSRNGCEGNFQLGGQRVNYLGVRPINQIYPIFQKMHMKSLNFINEYFDSKVKIFSNVENLLRNQLKKITQQCKAKYSFSADLNDSLDYQEYNEEESFRLNQNREIMYQPVTQLPKKDSVASTPSKYLQKSSLTPKKIKQNAEKADTPTKFFRKNSTKSRLIEQSKVSTEKNIVSEQQQPELTHQPSSPCVYVAKKSPFRANRQKQIQEKVPTTVLPAKKDYSMKQKEIVTEQREAVEKGKERPKPNNLRYLVNYHPEGQGEALSPKNKTNNVYKQTTRKSQSPESFKLPTFKALGEQIQQQSRLKINNPPPPKETNNQIYKQLPSQAPKEYTNHSQKEHISQVTLAQKDSSSLVTNASKNKGEPYRPAKPSYEDIEQRRKRILKDYQQMNQKQSANEHLPLRQYESPFNNIVFSVSKDEAQGNSTFMPLSISNQQYQRQKPQIERPSKQINNFMQRRGNYDKQNGPNLVQHTVSTFKKHSMNHTYKHQLQQQSFSNSYSYQDKLKERNNTYSQAERYQIEPQIPVRKAAQKDSPRKIKRSYQYVYE